MKKRLSKNVNRVISVVCLAVFAVSLVCVGSISYSIIASYRENERLKEEYKEVLQEVARLQEEENKVDNDGYYNVYSNGEEMVVYGNGQTIIITIQ